MAQTVLVERDGAVGIVTLNRPAALNAMDNALRARFRAVSDELEADRSVRAVVVTGAGERAFSTGADLKERDTMDAAGLFEQRTASVSKIVLAMRTPTVAAIHGYALGGGMELALACDLRVADETAVFGLPEVQRGFFPGGGACVLLARAVGPGRAKELILTANRLDAREAQAWGLLNRLVPEGAALETAVSLARQIAANAPLGVSQAKMVIDRALGLDLGTALALENEAWTRCLHSADRAEGIRAFVERRPPVFTGR